MFIVGMDNVEKVFVNAILVIQDHVVIFHVSFSIEKNRTLIYFLFQLIFVLVLIVIMGHVMKVVAHVQRVIQDRIVTLHV